jgi:hypothetical protein
MAHEVRACIDTRVVAHKDLERLTKQIGVATIGWTRQVVPDTDNPSPSSQVIKAQCGL